MRICLWGDFASKCRSGPQDLGQLIFLISRLFSIASELLWGPKNGDFLMISEIPINCARERTHVHALCAQ